MGEGLRYYRAPDTALQVIVPNLRCSLEGSRNILSIDDPPFSRVMSPHPGKTVSLQLDPNGELIGRYLIRPGLYLLNFIKGTKEVLHVMADFMCDSIGASKVSLWLSRRLYSLEKVHV
jgi:hypothetical protein